MDGKQFDDFTTALAESGTSRRSILQRVAGGGFAAALAAIGIGGFSAEDADAAKSCKKKCKKKKTSKQRRKCKKRCNTASPAGFAITVNLSQIGATCGGSVTCAAGLECVALVCAPIDLGDACTTGAQCSTGRCVSGSCTQCDTADVCGATPGSQQCCAVDATCVTGTCVRPQ